LDVDGIRLTTAPEFAVLSVILKLELVGLMFRDVPVHPVMDENCHALPENPEEVAIPFAITFMPDPEDPVLAEVTRPFESTVTVALV